MTTLHVLAWLAVAVILAWRVAIPLWKRWRAPMLPPRPSAALDSSASAQPDPARALIDRVVTLISTPSTPTTWEADHANIISDYSRPVMLEAIKLLVPRMMSYPATPEDLQGRQEGVAPPRVYPPMPHLNKWKVSNRARWHGSRRAHPGSTAGGDRAFADPPRQRNRCDEDLDVTIMDICEGVPNLVQADDGFRFDPRVDIELLEVIAPVVKPMDAPGMRFTRPEGEP